MHGILQFLIGIWPSHAWLAETEVSEQLYFKRKRKFPDEISG
jgi:hypothetical protein